LKGIEDIDLVERITKERDSKIEEVKETLEKEK